jgi:tetratricopeptide (TPR) repeat protein
MTDAEAAIRRAIDLDPQNAAGFYQLGLLLEQDTSRASEAEAAYRQALLLEPDNPKYVYRLGLLLHEQLKRPGEAEAAYRRAITLAPDNAFFYGGLVSLLIHESRRAEAVEIGNRMRSLLGPQRQWYGLATLEAILGNVDAAFLALGKAALKAGFNRDWAWRDPDLANIRGDQRFVELVGDG